MASRPKSASALDAGTQEGGGVFSSLVADILGQRRRVAFALAVVVASNVCLAFAPRVSESIVNGLSELGESLAVDWSWLLVQCFWLGLLYLVGYGAQGFVNRTMVRVAEAYTYALRNRVQRKLNRLPLGYVDTHPKGDVASILTNDVAMISQTLETTLPTLVGQGLLLLFVVIMMLVTDWLLALVYLVTLPLTVLITTYIAKLTRTSFRAQQDTVGALYGFMADAFANHTVVCSYGCEGPMEERFDRLNREFRRTYVVSRFFSGFMIPLGVVANNLSFIALCVFGGYLLLSGGLSLGVFTAFVFYGNMVGTPLSNLATSINTLQQGFAACERVYDFLGEAEMPVERPSARVNPASVAGRVSFDHVHFGYTPDKVLMHDVSLVAEPGMTMAVVGPSGAGKTTLINLLMRFYDIDGGTITLDGVDTKQLSRENLRSAFGMVLQDTWIFKGTVAENIGYGKPNATRQEIEAAARLVHCDEFIRKLPQGYDTVLSEESSALSVGEKQLLSIARTVIADPRILILDEATSNVDTKTEYLITRAMERMMEGKTSFMIAHRLFTIRNADKIIFMVGGDIKEVGSHEELMARRGLYHAMYLSASGETEEADYEEAEEELAEGELVGAGA